LVFVCVFAAFNEEKSREEAKRRRILPVRGRLSGLAMPETSPLTVPQKTLRKWPAPREGGIPSRPMDSQISGP
jgi:hypothetical protein